MAENMLLTGNFFTLQAESASLSEASQETPPTRPEALESVPPCLEVAGDVAQVGNQPTVSEMIEQAASPSSHTATEELQPELRTPPARQTGAHEVIYAWRIHSFWLFRDLR